MKVLITPRSFGKTNPDLFVRLKSAGLEVIRNESGGILSAEMMGELLAPCVGVIVGVDPLPAAVLEKAPHLRAVSKYGVGLDNIDLEYCKKNGIAVSRTVGANSDAVADYAFALMLAAARKVCLINSACHRKDWTKIVGLDVYGKTLGIIGLGAIGKRVAKRAAGFSMDILAFDPVWDDDYAIAHNIKRCDIDEIFAEADFVSLHCLLNGETANLVDARRLGLMKKTAVLINTARAGLIDEEALFAALEKGAVAGAGLDVFGQEPPLNPSWYSLDNVVMGSHAAASSAGSIELMGKMAVTNLLRDLGLPL